MIKVMFEETAMVRKAIDSGLCLYSYHLSYTQVEQEEFFNDTMSGML